MKLVDEVIIQRCLEGDGNAFSLLVERYQNAVYGLCYHMVGNFADAQDLTQETFVRVYLELINIREPSRFARWIHRITVNTCKMWLRSRKGVDDIPLESVPQTEEDFADNNSPAEHAEAEELRLSITEAIASLSEKNQLVITLYYINGLTYDEIGDFLSVSSSAVKSRLHRARKELKEELITMVEDKFDEHQLPENFSEKIVQEVVVSMVKMDEKKEGDEEKPVPAIVILANKDDEKRLLPIWIGMFEAIAILQKLNDSPGLPRPMTHDLMANMLEELGAKIVRVTITDLKESTFYAKIAIQVNGALKEIDARPSDSIALALRTDSPIFVAKSVLSEVGICPSDDFPGPKQPVNFISGKILNTGIIKKPLLSMFQIDSKFQDELSNDKFSDELRQELENKGISLPPNAAVSQKPANIWYIEGGDREYFIIKGEEDKLDFCSTVDQPKGK